MYTTHTDIYIYYITHIHLHKTCWVVGFLDELCINFIETISDPFCLAHTWICPRSSWGRMFMLEATRAQFTPCAAKYCKILDRQKDVAMISKCLPELCAAWGCWPETQSEKLSAEGVPRCQVTAFQFYDLPVGHSLPYPGRSQMQSASAT